ncbi:hypothetical protein [Streptomyces sp. NBC_00859]|uniref:hypothetical protein n=1 Tax=Streptomyces sp. NBC_00859 TaxID=2903682 RepID=UPI00386B1452|nr:hypothetical protein OG584_20660 [Streptomyces sp. NBC_00859]
MAERAWATAGNQDSPDRRSVGRVRLTGVVLVVLSLVGAVLSYLAFTVWVPDQQERYEHYRAAEPCPAQASPHEAATEECLTTRHSTVTKAESIHTGKVTAYEVTLEDRGDGSWHRAVRFSDSGPLVGKLHRGDEVTVTGWRREIVVLSKDGVRQNTSDAPRHEHPGNAALGVVVALLAAQSLVFGAVRLVRPTARSAFFREPYGRWLVFTNIGVGVGVGAVSVWFGIPWWTVFVTVPVLVCGVMVRLLHRQRRVVASSVNARGPRQQQDSRVGSR